MKKKKEEIEVNSEISNNGHEPPIIDDTDILEMPREEESDAEAIRQYMESKAEQDIPGNKYLFNVEDKHLPEASDLSLKEVYSFALADTQDKVLDLNRTESVYEIFRNRYLRYKIALNRQGREEFVTTHKVESEEKIDAANRGSILK